MPAASPARKRPMINRRRRFGAFGPVGGTAASRIRNRSPWFSVSMLSPSWASSYRLSSDSYCSLVAW